MYYQQAWLLKLQAYSPSPIYVAKNRHAGSVIPGQWFPLHSYPFFKEGMVDYRTILPNELCFEIDYESWDMIRFWGMSLQGTLKDLNIPYILCHSGGKGVHFHTFLSVSNLEQVVTWQQLRGKLWNYIIEQVDPPDEYRKAGSGFDPTSYSFSPRSQGHMIREIGGRKRQRKRLIKEIPMENAFIPGTVKYPKKIPIWRPKAKLLLSLNLENLEATGNCVSCRIEIPSRHKAIHSTRDTDLSNPRWIGCVVCKPFKAAKYVAL